MKNEKVKVEIRNGKINSVKVAGIQQKEAFPTDASFSDSKGVMTKLSLFLKEGDWWTKKSKHRVITLLTHDAVKKIAHHAGIKVVDYRILTQPDCYNNYQYTMMATVVNPIGEQVMEMGEANRSNLGSKGRSNPANMAQKRAFDRAVLNMLGMSGMLSEEELSDEEEDEKMETLTHDERKKIAPLLNNLILATKKEDLNKFNAHMKIVAKNYNENELNFLREMFKKRSGELSASKF